MLSVTERYELQFKHYKGGGIAVMVERHKQTLKIRGCRFLTPVLVVMTLSCRQELEAAANLSAFFSCVFWVYSVSNNTL